MNTNTLRIWGRMSSINVKKVVWTAQELGLEFQRTEAGGAFGVVKTPEYMRPQMRKVLVFMASYL